MESPTPLPPLPSSSAPCVTAPLLSPRGGSPLNAWASSPPQWTNRLPPAPPHPPAPPQPARRRPPSATGRPTVAPPRGQSGPAVCGSTPTLRRPGQPSSKPARPTTRAAGAGGAAWATAASRQQWLRRARRQGRC
eukprot:scaffold12452_cov113-Isochrysis_galbana.AAC.1